MTTRDHEDDTIGPHNWHELKPVYHDPTKVGCPRTALAALAKHLPVFRRPDFIIGTATPAREASAGVIHIGYFTLSNEAGALMRDAYDFGWVRGFEWMSWSQTLEGVYLLEDPCALIEADRGDLARVLTVCCRSAHWGSEALEDFHSSGLLVRILERASVLLTETTTRNEELAEGYFDPRTGELTLSPDAAQPDPNEAMRPLYAQLIAEVSDMEKRAIAQTAFECRDYGLLMDILAGIPLEHLKLPTRP